MIQTVAGPVLAWREMMFRALDLPDEIAAALAGLDIDWHDMADLLDAGCSPADALRILA